MRVCLFDIDGTLIDSGQAGQAAMEASLASLFGVTRPTEGISTAGRTDRAIIEDLMVFHDLCVDRASFGRVCEAYLQGLPAELARLEGTPLPGVGDLLEELSSREDVVLGLLTGNLVEGARRKLGHFALDTFFERDGRLFGGFGDDQRDRDDVARGGRERVRQELGWWDAGSVWVIGDTPLDVGCARAIDVRVLAVATGLFSSEQIAASRPDMLLEDLSETERVVSILLE